MKTARVKGHITDQEVADGLATKSDQDGNNVADGATKHWRNLASLVWGDRALFAKFFAAKTACICEIALVHFLLYCQDIFSRNAVERTSQTMRQFTTNADTDVVSISLLYGKVDNARHL